MGFRFRKTIKIIPGVKINISKSGLSTSLGGKGCTVNIGHGRVKTTLGLPGTGLSYQSQTKYGKIIEPLLSRDGKTPEQVTEMEQETVETAPEPEMILDIERGNTILLCLGVVIGALVLLGILWK